MIVRSIRNRNIRYSEIIRVLYRMNCIIKLQRWWKRKMYLKTDNLRQIVLR
jgi:hypothetical protein